MEPLSQIPEGPQLVLELTTDTRLGHLHLPLALPHPAEGWALGSPERATGPSRKIQGLPATKTCQSLLVFVCLGSPDLGTTFLEFLVPQTHMEATNPNSFPRVPSLQTMKTAGPSLTPVACMTLGKSFPTSGYYLQHLVQHVASSEHFPHSRLQA